MSSVKKRGRKQSPVWKLFTDAVEPHKAKSNVCMHCKTLVHYHKKSEYVMAHLKDCRQFSMVMNSLEADERPDWYCRKLSASNVAVESKAEVGAALTPAQSANRQLPLKGGSLQPVTKAKFQEKIALHYYTTGTPFQQIEDQHLVEAIQLLRPEINVLPTSQELATTLLDKVHGEMTAMVERRLKGSTACLIVNALSRSKKACVINYMTASSDGTFYLDSVACPEEQEADFLAVDIDSVLTSQSSIKFSGVIMDNTDVNKKARETLQAKHPSMFFQGCSSHGLHLLAKEIFTPIMTKQANDTDVTFLKDQQLEYLRDFIEKCTEVVKFFENHDDLKTRLEELQQSNDSSALVYGTSSRWRTIKNMVKSLLESQKYLLAIVDDEEFSQDEDYKNVHDTITASDFTVNLTKLLAILEPLDLLTTKFQSDKTSISDVMHDFLKLEAEFTKLYTTGTINDVERDYLVGLSKKHFESLYGDAHGISYLLDPVLLGQELNGKQRRSLEDTLLNLPIDDATPTNDNRREELYLQYTEFLIAASKEKEANSFRFKMLAQRKKTPLEWWLTDGTHYPVLQQIAVKLFSLVPSSTTSKQAFAKHGVLPFNVTNSLTPEAIEKLIYIKCNHFASNDAVPALSDNNGSVDFDELEGDEKLDPAITNLKYRRLSAEV
ncbi:hypothetical protein LEN26_009120 [Aphanomyces euteiches]|nr:hypothetical protein LEN26_009120 [Aphanomyces euteiches]